MKFVLIICIVALAGVLGYLAEPTLRPMVTGQSASDKSGDQAPDTDVIVIKTPYLDPHDYAPEQLPETLTVTYPTRFVVESSKISLEMPPGSIVKLIKLDGKQVIVSPAGSNFKVPMSIENTDLLDQLSGITPIPPSERKAPEPPKVAENTGTSQDTMPAEASDSVASNPPPAEETADTPDEPEIAAEPEKEESPELNPVSTSDLLALMKNSILKNQIKEFTFEQVKTWDAGENETVDNTEFQTGNVTYETETLFGKKTIEARAYIRNGKVVRWVWPKSGIELE